MSRSDPDHPRRAGILEAAIVLAALLTVGLLVVSTQLTSTTLDRNAAWLQAIGRIELDVAMSYAWGEVRGAADAQRQARGSARAATVECRTLLDSVDRDARGAVGSLCDRVDSFRVLAGQVDRRGPRAGYDAAFASALRRADEAEHAVAIAIAERRRTLNRIGAGIVALVLLVFASMALVVARRARQLAAHNERLRRLDRMKDTFIAAVSHELRTPLTSTLGALQTVERADIELGEEMRADLLRMARVQSERLAQLVDELLFFSGVEAGHLRLSATAVNLSAVVAEVGAAAAARAEARGVTLRLDTEEVLPLSADRGRIAQLLKHLIDNAIKFTPTGGRVDVRAEAVGSEAVLEVVDTGVGIPRDEQRHLFERFFRSSRAVDQAVPGVGVGLSIVKAIVDAHNGTVTVESEEQAGTTVRVKLPLTTKTAPAPPETVDLRRARVTRSPEPWPSSTRSAR